MIKLKNILNEHYWNERKFGEPLPKLRLEQEEPEHFGGGENIEVYGYQTENFDICKSAVMLFNKLNELEIFAPSDQPKNKPPNKKINIVISI